MTAKDKATGKEQQIRIQASGGLSEADIDKMVKDAEAHAADDKKRRELVDARNQGEAMIHSAEKSLKEFGDKVAEADKSAIEAAIASLKTALEGEDVEAINARANELAQASMKLGEAMYKAEQATGGAGAAGGGRRGRRGRDRRRLQGSQGRQEGRLTFRLPSFGRRKPCETTGAQRPGRAASGRAAAEKRVASTGCNV